MASRRLNRRDWWRVCAWGWCGAAAICALVGLGGTARGDEPASATATATATVPVSATSQCVEGPGAPPANPNEVVRVAPGQPVPMATEKAPATEKALAPDDPRRVSVEVSALVGLSARLDDSPGFPTTDRVGPLFAGFVAIAPRPWWSLGLGYSFIGLGAEQTAKGSTTDVNVTRRLHAAWGTARVAPWRVGPASFWVDLGAGLVWQEAALRATFVSVDASRPSVFTCRRTTGPDLGLRVLVGTKVKISDNASLVLGAGLATYRLTDQILDGCAPGAGAAQTFWMNGGLAYDFDVTRAVK